jgi:uncharacterized membrane protein HdeD (DUF308 family)
MDRKLWPLVLRGVAAIVFGVIAVLWPGITLLALAILFGVYVLVEGVLTLASALRERLDAGQRVARVLVGLLSLAAGIVALVWPQITALVLVLLIGAWALVTGALDVFVASRTPAQWGLVVLGVLSMVAGALILFRPDAGAFAVAVVIGFFAIMAGVLRFMEAWRLHREHHTPPTPRAAPA